MAKKIQKLPRPPGAASRAVEKSSKPKKKTPPDREGYHLPTRSEQEQFAELSEDLQDAWGALKSFCLGLGEQKPMHTSHRSIMFTRGLCYAFVRPKKSYIELNFFLAEALDSDLLHKVVAVSKKRTGHVLKLVHPDQVDRPLTDWLRRAYEQAAG